MMPSERITIKDIAREAGVSTSLVSFVMRNVSTGKQSYRVSKETTDKILKVAERLDYHPSLSARMLKSGVSNTIGVVLSDISNNFFAEFARNVCDEADILGYSVLFSNTDEDLVKFKKTIDVLLNKGVDGFIIVPCEGSEKVIGKLKAKKIPTLLLDRDFNDIGLPSVLLDNRLSSKTMTDELVREGYRHIEMISYSMKLSNFMERERGYEDSMKDHGLSKYIKIHRLEHHESHGIVDSLIENARKRGVEAFIFATNTLAIWGMSSILKSGYHVPQDFGIACFDKNETFDIYDTEVIYAQQPIKEFATASMSILARLISGVELGEEQCHIVLKSEIINLDKINSHGKDQRDNSAYGNAIDRQ